MSSPAPDPGNRFVITARVNVPGRSDHEQVVRIWHGDSHPDAAAAMSGLQAHFGTENYLDWQIVDRGTSG